MDYNHIDYNFFYVKDYLSTDLHNDILDYDYDIAENDGKVELSYSNSNDWSQEIRNTILNLEDKNVIVHLWSKVAWNGTFGKIAISKNNLEYPVDGFPFR